MKLRNFMYATMIACAFASCSKDEVPTPDQATGSFTISVAAKGKVTKAATKANQSNEELTINNLTVHVYRVDANDVKTWVTKVSTNEDFVSKTEDATGYTKLTVENLPLNATYVCYGYANLGEAAPSGDNVEFGAAAVVAMDGDAGFVETNLPMVGESESKALSATGTEYTINLIRTVSRVDIVGLDLDVDADGTTFGASKASFKLTDISINGVTSKVKSDLTAESATTTWGWLTGDAWNNAVTGKSFFHATFSGNEVTNAATDAEATAITWGDTKTASEENPAASFYILPKPGTTSVKVALEGLFGYTKDDQVTIPLASTYPVVVAKDGMTTAGALSNGTIENNKLYRISITVAGPGSYGRGSMIIAASVSDYELRSQVVVVE